MAAKQAAKKKEPTIIKTVSTSDDQLIREGLNSGQIEEFVVLPRVAIKRLCKFGNDLIIVYHSGTNGGVVVFDPFTKALKQHIKRLTTLSCKYDKDYLVLGGADTGIIYVFQYVNNEFQLSVSKQLHEGDATVLDVAINASMNTIVSVGGDKKAIVSNLTGGIIKRCDLPSYGRCVVISNEFAIAFVGCDDGTIVIIDLIDSLKSALSTHGGRVINCFVTEGETLVSGGNDHQIIKWKINQISSSSSSLSSLTTLTQIWNYNCENMVTSLYLYSNQIFVNVAGNNATISINVDNGKLEKQYSKTECSFALVVLENVSLMSTTSEPPSTGASPPPSPATQGMSSYASRLTAIEDASTSTLNPIFGLEQTPLVSLADSLNGLSTTDIPDLGVKLKGAIYLARKGCKNTPAPLTDDEAAAINIYTMETPLYGALNEALRSADRNAIRPFFKYLKLLLTALYKLPAETLHVYRGVNMSLPSSMKKGEELLWWSLTSTTSSMDVLSNPMFLGQAGDRVLFNISATAAINIKKYSAVKSEDEYLLLPGTCLEVKAVLTLAPGLHSVQLQQIDAPPFLDFVHPALNN